MWLTDPSPGQMLLLAWVVLQIFGWLTRKNVPAGPPGGRVIAIHSEAEYAQEQLKAKESGALVRTPGATRCADAEGRLAASAPHCSHDASANP